MAATDQSEPSVRDRMDDILELSALREDGKQKLLEVLESFRGRKCLTIDSQLGGLLNQIIVEGSRLLKDNGVQYFRELKNETEEFIQEVSRDMPDNFIYMIRPEISSMKIIAQQIKAIFRNGFQGIKSHFHVCFVPSQATVCLHMLEHEINNTEVWDKISFGEFHLGLIPYDTDLLTLEMDSVFKKCYVDGDLSPLKTIGMALMQIQDMYGFIPNVCGKGVAAKLVLQKLLQLRKAQDAGEGLSANAASRGRTSSMEGSTRSEIDTMIILDREVDWVSPMITPLTYEGLVDDTLTIEHGRVRLDSAIVDAGQSEQQMQMQQQEEQQALAARMAAAGVSGATAAAAAATATSLGNQRPTVAAGEKVTIVLNNNDPVFAEIRDLSIEQLGGYLQEKAVHIKQRYTQFRDNKDASITEIHDFVKKIPKLTKDFQSLHQHINIAELLKKRTDSREFRDQWQGERGMIEGEGFLDAIEEIVYADVDGTQLLRVLRLFCLQSLTGNGVRATRYDNTRKLIIHTYGMEQVVVLNSLEKAGLLKRKDNLLVVETASTWPSLRKLLRLTEDSEDNVNDISYVTAGYSPLLVRLVQLLGQQLPGWVQLGGSGPLLEAMKLLPGPLVQFSQLTRAEDLEEAVKRSEIEAIHYATTRGNPLPSTSSSSFGAASLLNYTSGIMSGTTADSQIGKTATRSSVDSTGVEKAIENASSTINNVLDADFLGLNDRVASLGLAGDGVGISNGKKIMLIFVVGGLSFLEIAAFRVLSRDPQFPYRLLLASTKLGGGAALINSLPNIHEITESVAQM